MRKDLSTYRHTMPSEIMKNTFPNNFLENFFNNSFMAGFTSSMRSDIKETGQEFILEVEMPGYSKENISIECKDGRLTISAANSQDMDESEGSYVRQERQSGRMSRSYRVDGIDEDQISAQYRNGILKVTLPKSSERQDQIKRIDIH